MKKKRTIINLEVKLLQELDDYCKKNYTYRNIVVMQAVREYLSLKQF